MEFVTVNFDFNQEYCNEKSVPCPVQEGVFDNGCAKLTHLSQPFHKFIYIGEAGFLGRDFFELADEFGMGLKKRDEITCLTLGRILYKMLRVGDTICTDTVKQVREYVALNYSEALDNRLIGKALGYHPYYLNSLFKRATGKTIHSYLTEYRIDTACEMLSSTRKTVGEIALECGFVNPDHFSYRFKCATGLSPLEYRKKDVFI